MAVGIAVEARRSAQNVLIEVPRTTPQNPAVS